MKNLSSIGTLFFAVAIAAFGIEFFVFGNLSALMPIIPSGSTRMLWIVIIGLLLVFCGASIGFKKLPSLGALAVVAVFVLITVFTQIPDLIANVRNPGPWTVTAELLALAGGALMIAGGTLNARIGSFLVAYGLVVVGVQHMLYADFIATLITPWIPKKLFFAYFVGVAFFAAAISIGLQIKSSLAGLLLGIMFLTWVVILHAPRVIGNVYKESECTSLFVALGFGAVGLIVAGRGK